MIQDAYSSLLQEIGLLGVVFFAGMFVACILLVEAAGKGKARRAKAELRRQKRQHRADLAREKAHHAAALTGQAPWGPTLSKGSKPFDAICAVDIRRQRLMNKSEYRLYKILQELAPTMPGRPLVFPQIPIGEILHVAGGSDPDRKRANREIQSKRVDFVLTDGSGQVLAAVEFQGSGHYQGSAAYRDQIKQAIFRRAGVPLIELFPDMTREAIEARLRRDLQSAQPLTFAPLPCAHRFGQGQHPPIVPSNSTPTL